MAMRGSGWRSNRASNQWFLLLLLAIYFVAGASLVVADAPAETSPSCDDAPASETDPPTAQDLLEKVYADEAWLGEVDSLLLRLRRFRTYTDEGMKPQEFTLGSGQKQTVTPSERTLAMNTLIAWDKARVVIDFHLGDYTRSWTSWNGNLAVRSFRRFARDGNPESLSYVLDNKTDILFRDKLQTQLMWGSVARRMGPKTWWRVLDRYESEETRTPTTARLIGRETYRGHDCYRVDSDEAHRFYIRISDGRLVANVYVASPLSSEERLEIMSEIVGRPITGREWRPWLDTLEEKERLDAYHRYREEAYKNAIVRLEECFDDYREVAPGCWLPYDQQSYRYTTIAKKAVLTQHSETTILDLQVGTELSDDLFEQEIVEGAPVTTDWRYDPPIRYTYSASQSEEEREKLATAKRMAYEEGRQYLTEAKAAIDRKIGLKPPPLPEEGWIHSEPLTWEALKGKAVALLFWDVGCGPCHGPLGRIQNGYKTSAEQNGIYIAVHRATDDRSMVEKHLAEQGWTFPVLIDGSGEDDTSPSLFEWFGIQAMPWMVTIGKDGSFVAHDHPGLSSTIFTQFVELAQQPAAKAKQPDK